MKKYLLTGALLVCQGIVFAQGAVSLPRNLVYVTGGGGVHTEGASAVPMQKGTAEGSLGFVRFLSDTVAVGLEGSFGRTDGKGEGLPPSNVPDTTIAKQKDNYFSHWGIGAVGRLYVKPRGRWRWYIPAGVGYRYLKQNTKYELVLDPAIYPPFIEWSEDRHEKAKRADGVYLYTGLGMEYDFKPWLSGQAQVHLQAFKLGGQWLKTIQAEAGIGLRF